MIRLIQPICLSDFLSVTFAVFTAVAFPGVMAAVIAADRHRLFRRKNDTEQNARQCADNNFQKQLSPGNGCHLIQ